MHLVTALLLSILETAGTSPSSKPASFELQPCNIPPGPVMQPFKLDAASTSLRIWGRGNEAPRVYVDEFLPALFERTLVFEHFDLQGGTIEWIFTGPRAGFTIHIQPSILRVRQRYYASFGLNELQGNGINAKRHPEKQWIQDEIRYSGQLQTVTVRLDHRLGLEVELNGQPVIRQSCLFDVSRHQMRMTGTKSRVVGSLHRPATVKTDVRIEPAITYQQIIGFGGITTPTAYAQLSKEGRRRWWSMLCEYNLLIQREYPNGQRLHPDMDNFDRLGDAMPHYYGDNFPNGEISDFDYIRTLRRLGGLVWFEFWDLPLWVKQPQKDNAGTSQPSIAVEEYARAMVRYCQISKDRAGDPPDVLGIQNEKHQPADVWHAMTLALRQKLDHAGFNNVRIHMSDSGSLADGITRANVFRQSPPVWKAIDYVATHMYDYQRMFTEPDRYDPLLEQWKQLADGRPFLSTELCVNSPAYQVPSYRLALQMGQLYHKNLAIADASALCYCWLLLNVVQPSYGWTRSLMVPDPAQGFIPVASSHQLRVFGAYSRHLPAGMKRIQATATSPDLLVCAFGGEHGQQTLIMLNRASTAQTAWIQGIGTTISHMEITDAYHPNQVQTPPQPDRDGKTVTTIPPGAIVTLSNVPLRRLPDDFIIDH